MTPPSPEEALRYALRCCDEWLRDNPMPVDEHGMVSADMTHQEFLAIHAMGAWALGLSNPYGPYPAAWMRLRGA